MEAGHMERVVGWLPKRGQPWAIRFLGGTVIVAARRRNSSAPEKAGRRRRCGDRQRHRDRVRLRDMPLTPEHIKPAFGI
jgi:hypothetical protein